MLIQREKHITPKILYLLNILAFALLFSSSAQTHANKQASIDFHLPVHSERFPELIPKLKTALNDAGLAHIQLRPADYWQNHQYSIRKGKTGIYLTAPHFAAWAIHKHKFVPVVRIAEPLKFVIASKKADSQYFEITDLNKQLICTQNPLNLDYVLVNSVFKNSLLSADTHTVTSVNAHMSNPQTPCVAFAVSNHYFIQHELEQPGRFIRLQQGNSFNNYAVVIHPSLLGKKARRLRKFLLSEKAQILLSPILKLTSNNPQLIKASKRNYPESYITPLIPYWRETIVNSE